MQVVVSMNIVYNTLAASFYQHFGRANSISNNIFAFAFGGYGILWHDADPSFGPSDFSFTENIVLVDERAGGVFECPYVGNNTYNRNLYFNNTGAQISASFPTTNIMSCNGSFAAWQHSGHVRRN